MIGRYRFFSILIRYQYDIYEISRYRHQYLVSEYVSKIYKYYTFMLRYILTIRPFSNLCRSFKALRYDTHSQGISPFCLHTPRSSANAENHTCLFLLSRSWYSLTDHGSRIREHLYEYCVRSEDSSQNFWYLLYYSVTKYVSSIRC